MKRFFATIAALSLLACATPEKFAARMNSFVGKTEAHLISELGFPSGSYALNDGTKIVSFRRQSTMKLGGNTTYMPVNTNHNGTISAYNSATPYATYQGNSVSYQPVKQPEYDIQMWCEARFVIDKSGAVSSWTSSGNRCVSE